MGVERGEGGAECGVVAVFADMTPMMVVAGSGSWRATSSRRMRRTAASRRR